MKKLLLVFIIFLMGGTCFSQNAYSDFNEYSKQVDSSGIYLQNAANDIGFAFGFSVLSASAFVWAASIVKKDNYDPDMDDPKVQRYIGYGFGAVSFLFLVAHIVHLSKAGKHLRNANRIYQKQQKVKLTLQQSNNGIGLALKF